MSLRRIVSQVNFDGAAVIAGALFICWCIIGSAMSFDSQNRIAAFTYLGVPGLLSIAAIVRVAIVLRHNFETRALRILVLLVLYMLLFGALLFWIVNLGCALDHECL
jgi:ABC-type Na+ efflux pump permease subunit